VLNCQRATAAKMIARGGATTFWRCQASLHGDVSMFLADTRPWPPNRSHTTFDGDHGHIETRTGLFCPTRHGCSKCLHDRS
jgi:hypothetical protein